MKTADKFASQLECTELFEDIIEAIRLRDAEQRKAGAREALDAVEKHWRTHSHDGVVRSCAAARARIESGSTVP